MRWTISFLLCYVAFVDSAPQQDPTIPAASDMKCTKDDGTSGKCVKYYLCTTSDLTLIDDIGMIDIRQHNPCENYLDVCCGTSNITEETSTPIPSPVIPTRPVIVTLPVVTKNITTSTIGSCGVRNPNGINFKIRIDDDEAQYDEFPWMVAILKEEFDTLIGKTSIVYTCGGSLIHPKVVLTAAQCVLSEAGSAASTLKIRAGEWDTQTENEISPHQDREVIKIISHNDYSSGASINDIALLILKTPVDDADNVGVVCLPPANVAPPTARCLASGWGKDGFGKADRYQTILKKVELPIVEHRKCQTELRKTKLGNKFELHKSFICVGGESGKDRCKGDGGSPLVCPVPNDSNRYMQSGIVSWGIRCGENIPGVYANVGYFREWIDRQLINNNIDMSPYAVWRYFYII